MADIYFDPSGLYFHKNFPFDVVSLPTLGVPNPIEFYSPLPRHVAQLIADDRIQPDVTDRLDTICKEDAKSPYLEGTSTKTDPVLIDNIQSKSEQAIEFEKRTRKENNLQGPNLVISPSPSMALTEDPLLIFTSAPKRQRKRKDNTKENLKTANSKKIRFKLFS